MSVVKKKVKIDKKPIKADVRRVHKSSDAFRTISEVADEIEVPQHVLRFWETKFPQLRPLKRGGGRRYYRPEEVEFLRVIRTLLYSRGYSIKGVQKFVRNGGLRLDALKSIAEADLLTADALNGSGAGEAFEVGAMSARTPNTTQDARNPADAELRGRDDLPLFSPASTSEGMSAEIQLVLEELLELKERLSKALQA